MMVSTTHTFEMLLAWNLVDISEVRILPVRQIIEPMSRADILSKLTILLLVAESQIEPQESNDEEKCGVATEMNGK